GAIRRRTEGYLGEERFRDGIRLYMRKHREANATADDLWGALAESSGQPILELANGWIRQVGYPLVSVSERDGRLVLRQRRFFSDPEAKEEGPPVRWLVPIVLRFREGAAVREQRELLRGEERQLALEAQGKPVWVLANAGARGFYRVAYEPALLRRLIEALPELESDERRLRRAAVLRGLALVARDPQAVEEAQERFRRLVAPQPGRIDPNLLDVVVAAAARTADRARFAELRRRAEEELDPAAKRRFLHALAMVEHPELVLDAVQLSLTDVVRMQDFPSYMGTLLGNRATRA